jgi:hypothetical protein
MQGCAVVLFVALIVILLGGAAARDLTEGFVIGLIAGLLVALFGVWGAGWNAHVAHVEDRSVTRAHDEAQRDRR